MCVIERAQARIEHQQNEPTDVSKLGSDNGFLSHSPVHGNSQPVMTAAELVGLVKKSRLRQIKKAPEIRRKMTVSNGTLACCR
jgi:hypothetical protein